VKVSRSRDFFGMLAFIVLCFGVAALGERATADSLEWYEGLRKPSWTPPGWVFGPVWTVLYALMAVAGWRAWREGRSPAATLLFLLQLGLNLLWSWLFFGLRRPDLGLVGVVLLWLALLATIVAFRRVSRAAWLLVPYFGWVSFAAALNLQIWRMN
jgi:tryptophan-rich sensory protein